MRNEIPSMRRRGKKKLIDKTLRRPWQQKRLHAPPTFPPNKEAYPCPVPEVVGDHEMRLPGMGPGTQTSLSALGPVWLSVSVSVYQGLFSRNVVPLKERKTCRFKKRAEREKDGNRIIRSNTTKPDRHRPKLSVRPVQSTMPQLSIPIGAAHVSFHFHFPTFPPAPKDVHVPRVLTVLYSSVSSVCNEAISASACGARSFRTLMLTKPRRQPGNSGLWKLATAQPDKARREARSFAPLACCAPVWEKRVE